MKAILLAAGMGTRLRPLTLDTPKSLVKVNGKPILEKQIEFLKEIGIEEIIIVTGYLKEKFEYLRDKYKVTLIHNDKYNQYNNIYTMYLVREYLPDSYVIDADVYLNRNFLINNPKSSLYFSAKKLKFKNEWMLRYDDRFRINRVDVGDGYKEYILTGISYWAEEDGKYIIRKLEDAISKGDFKDLYWDDMVKDNINDLNVFLHRIKHDDSFEIDTLEDLGNLNKLLKI